MSTISEKIFTRASGNVAHANDFVMADIDYAMAHDVTSVLAVRAFREMGVEKVWDADKIVIPFDHLVPAGTEVAAALQKDTREWIMQQNIRHFYEGGEGVCHQVLPEQGFALPGKLIVGADSHSCTYGAFGAFGTGVGATDMAEISASGKLWFRVPETIKMTVDGTLEKGVYAKDLTLYLIGKTGISGATYKAVEFYGTAVSDLSVSGRMTLCNMAIEMGAKTGIVPPDKKTFDFLQNRSMVDFEPAYADKDAVYCRENDFDAKDIEPQIACPHEVDNVVPISKVAGIHIDQAFLGTCTNGRFEDLSIAADILKGKKTIIRTVAAPASRCVLLEAVQTGVFETLVKAGVTFISPGCGPCLGAHQGIIAEGENCISTANRNFKGRMGKGGNVYLASPASVAAAALTGKITDPREYV